MLEETAIEVWGAFGFCVIGMGWYIRRLLMEKADERSERIAAQESERETLKSVLPAIEAQAKVLAYLEGSRKS